MGKVNFKYKNFILFWFSQSVSELGSAMTSFALILWAYTKTNSAMAVSLMAFFSYVPYIIVSIFAGPFIDKGNKKSIMLICDLIAAACSFIILVLVHIGGLKLYHIYIVNFIIGFMNSFQSPSKSVAMGLLVDKDFYSRASGMNSFSESLLMVFAPIFASTVMSFAGIRSVIYIDLSTFAFAFVFLAFFIKIPENKSNSVSEGVFKGIGQGFKFLKEHKVILYIVLTMAILNFFSRLTYENILSPMILSRSSNNYNVLGIVNGLIGAGGIAGGLIVSVEKMNCDSVKIIYFSAAFSFLFGDLFMAIGKSLPLWSFAAVAASFPIPFILTAQNTIIYNTVPEEIQGRIFAVKNALQYSLIPIGILLGGFLADYVFEPFMAGESTLASFLHILVGSGGGSGMAVMFICTSILGSLSSLLGYIMVKRGEAHSQKQIQYENKSFK